MNVITHKAESYKDFKVTVISKDLSQDDFTKLSHAVEHVAKAMASKKFYDFCINYEYNFKECAGFWFWKQCWDNQVEGMRWTGNMSQEEVYEFLMDGKEVLDHEVDREADIELYINESYSRNVIGYTYPNTPKQWIYRRFFNSFDYREIAGNIAHEWCHKMGFNHEYRWNYLRKHTVPYAVGYFVRDFQG